ncbi:MAG: hypothetical protein A4E45_01785 [Methanosaeta sp. PtaB.Bin039]|nr:MAG: hypothetical protein A4E45_01785 [Methanosaeta sp. PtaB.Bin039]HOT08022.1 hypothetical protein [Methanotrichaceae archaeon]HQF17448.1 hypothetical protein [Methanotrichaceae archaeon]HQI92058.1 hypothetical protein [Methanotrichaceae archaeon]HQJ29441.1 hypothetical protein [Methanotrichaceae archaeon]
MGTEVQKGDYTDISIGDERYREEDLRLLAGGEDTLPGESLLLLARVLKNPMRLPLLLKQICGLRSSLQAQEREEFRLGLIRIQIEADLHMHEDIQRFQQRRYVAQVIEMLIFQDLLLAPREMEEESLE